MDAIKTALLKLIREALNPSNTAVPLPDSIDWRGLLELCERNGVCAIALDGIQQFSKPASPKNSSLFPNENKALSSFYSPDSQKRKLQWIAHAISIEQNYERHIKVMAELARFYRSHGIEMLVAKGYGLSLNYPLPRHRPLGDIDIWLFGKQKEADDLLEKEMGIKIDKGHHHHSVFDYHGVTIENYSDFLCVPGHRSNAAYEKILKEWAMKERESQTVGGESIYFPGPNFNALFVLKHTATHFAATEMTLRQLLDWGTLAQRHTKSIDWTTVRDIAKRFNLLRFMNCLNALCIDHLGFPATSFPPFERDAALEERILNDILSPEFQEKAPNGFIRGIAFKYKRWKANAWKHKITFRESLAETLLTQAFAHLQKPKSLRN